MTTKITSEMDGLRLETSGDGNVTVTAEAPVKVSIDTLIAELTSFSLAESGGAEESYILFCNLVQGFAPGLQDSVEHLCLQ